MSDTGSLTVLLRDLNAARVRHAAQRRRVGRLPDDVAHTRADLLHALQTYTEALESRGLPVPYRLRDELRVRRRVGAPR